MNRIVRGAIAGATATLPMTGVMYGGKAIGLLQTPPPRQITGNAARKANKPPEQTSEQAFNASWVAAHLGFGIGCGIAYALIRPLLPANTVTAGILFGGAVWAISYVEVMPRLGLYPNPSEDSNSRTAVMIAAHATYGLALAEMERAL